MTGVLTTDPRQAHARVRREGSLLTVRGLG